MRRQAEQGSDSFVQRHLSQLKVMARLMEYELAAAKQGPSLSLDRDLVENWLDVVEIFVDDFDDTPPARKEREVKSTANEGKATVTRLN